MAQKGIREYHAKTMLGRQIENLSKGTVTCKINAALVSPGLTFDELISQNPWISETRLVVKPDQLFGKRGKNGLVYTGPEQEGASIDEAWEWILQKSDKPLTLDSGIEGDLTHFLIEPFIPHTHEYYVAISTEPSEDVIAFSTKGGVDVESHTKDIVKIGVPIEEELTDEMTDTLLEAADGTQKDNLRPVLKALLAFFRENHVTSLELNPFAINDRNLVVLDAVVRLDDTASFLCSELWGKIEFPPAFGKTSGPEEDYISRLDARTGASLKLTLLNKQGKIWTMVAGGGSSVIYADTVVDLGYGRELSNYGEYSGNPTEEDTCEYAKNLLGLMTQNNGKALIIGGGIANFTDVAKTFTGIIRALTEYADLIREKGIKIFVRRGGPNYEKGLELIRETAGKLDIDLQAYGPESHMTRIVKMAINAI